MEKFIKRAFIALVLFIAGSAIFASETIDITIMETSDLHGTIFPYDYASDKATDYGLVKAATVIKAERAKDPDLILIDNGDALQGNLIQEFRKNKQHPMIAAMNHLKYDAYVLGNHEFNFEFEYLKKAISQYKAPVLAANIYKADGSRFVGAYTIKEVKGVKVAIIGLTAPHVDEWEAAKPENFNNMTFTEPVDELAKVIEEIGDSADVIICASHYGLKGEFGSVGMEEIANKFSSQIPVFLIGHEHGVVNQMTADGKAIIMEPGSLGSHVSKVVLTLQKDGDDYTVAGVVGENIPIKGAGVANDKALQKIANKTHRFSQAIANSEIGTIKEDMLPSLWWNGIEGIPTATLQDTAMMDIINTVQMKNANADVSMAALFNASSNLQKGKFLLKDSVKIYPYDNTLFRVKTNGKELKAIMEKQAGDFFNTFKEGDVTISFNENMRLYVYDMFAGVDYEIDVSKPQGSRIQNVMFKGEPLRDDQELYLAINNYRYGTLASQGYLSSDPKDFKDTALAIRDLVGEYIAEHKDGLTAECDNNWKIVGYSIDPQQAEEVYALVREGKVKIPTSADGRSINIKSLNYNELKEQGLL